MNTSDGIGPVEYLVVGFPGSHFEGRIMPELTELASSGTVRIIDLLVVSRTTEGAIEGYELDELDPKVAEYFAPLRVGGGMFLSEEDVQLVAEALEPGDSAAILVWEDVWATRLADAIRDAGGVMIALDRVPREVVEIAAAAGTGV